MPRLLHFVLLSVTFALPIRAQSDDNVKTNASLHAETSTVAPASTFSVALKLEHPEGWHSYYLNSGGIELPPSIHWTLPAGFTTGPIQWPTPEVKDGYFGKSFVYTGTPVLLVDITAPDNLPSGDQVVIHAHATWQICKESCISEEQSFTLTLPTTAQPEMDAKQAPLFASARRHLPDLAEPAAVHIEDHGDSIVIRYQPRGGSTIAQPNDFIPDQPFAKSVSSGGEITADTQGLVIRLPRATKDALDNDIPQGDSLSGILITGNGSVRFPPTAINPATAGAGEAPPSATAGFGLIPILGGMFLGGLLLNLMPCVFPVIGLKIMGFVQQAGEDRKKIILHGLMFTAGVLLSFAVLSGILFAARSASAGDAVGWGYQLQNPWVVLSLMLLMFVLALNMAGVFEIGTSATSIGGSLQSKQGLGGSFLSGILATVVATPCSAPFLGAAIGAAIALPPVQFFTAFAAMALGLSTPYLMLSAFPKLIDLLPRPGAWMESFKQGMSFLLFATAGYLLWVYAGQIDLDNLLNPIIGLSAIAVAAWIHGRWNLPHRTKRTRATALGLTITFAAAGLFLAKPPKPSTLEWQTWSPEKVEQLLQDGTPVYIDFTAKWCATCQVNKKRAYTPEVIAMMHEKGVVALKADKTKPNPEIDKAIQQLGRAAIPVNVLLAPGKDPVILPELLSPDDVMHALDGL